ncbi:MAG: GNAT family N-acetyltransferase [Chloroflexota bacterium]
MTSQIKITQATVKEADIVAGFVYALECELLPDQKDDFDRDALLAGAQKMLEPTYDGFWALIAYNEANEAVGLLTLNECAAIYAQGRFGEIPELYIIPDYRSAGVGAHLIEAASDFGRQRNWPFLEVGAPSVPRWQRTVDFYQRQGFTIVGPRLELIL